MDCDVAAAFDHFSHHASHGRRQYGPSQPQKPTQCLMPESLDDHTGTWVQGARGMVHF